MEEIKGFTPEPWELQTQYKHDNKEYLMLYARMGVLHKPIARLYPDCEFADDQDKANAHLLVQAPTLYTENKKLRAALKSIIEWTEDDHDEPSPEYMANRIARHGTARTTAYIYPECSPHGPGGE